MSIFQYVRAQLGDSLLERICRRHCENKQTFFELLQTMTGVKIIPQFEDGGYVIEGSWEAMERCHTVLYKYHAELCSEELADLADQQHYPLIGASSLMASKKPSPDSASCVALEPITPNSTFSVADSSLPLNNSIQSSQSDNEFSSLSSSSSRCLDLSLKTLSNGGSRVLCPSNGLTGGQVTPTNGHVVDLPHTPNLGLTPMSCYSSVNGSFSNGLGADNDDENDNVSVGGSSEYSNESPIDIDSAGIDNNTNGLNLGLALNPAKTALDCLMDMKIEPGNGKNVIESGRFLPSPQSELMSLQNGIDNKNDGIVTSSTPRGLNNRKTGGSSGQRRALTSPSVSTAASGGIESISAGVGGASSANGSSQFMPTKTDQTKVHPCPFCPVTLGSSMNLKKHIQRKHSTPLHKCDICGKAYGFVNDLREHKKIHFLNLPCNQCEKVFKSRRSLLGHLSIAHKDSGVPPPPPPPSATFPAAAISSTSSSTSALTSSTESINTSLTTTAGAGASITPPAPMGVSSLSWSLSAITNYFNAAGLDLDGASSNSPSSGDKQCIPPIAAAAAAASSAMAQNLLHEFDSRLIQNGTPAVGNGSNPLSSTPAKLGLTNSAQPNVNCFNMSNGGVLNLTKTDKSSSSGDKETQTPKAASSTSAAAAASVLEKLAGNNIPVSVSSAIPMEVSCQ